MFENIKKDIPLKSAQRSKILKNREEIKNILLGKDSRKLLLVGPCSAWPEKAVLEYAKKLQTLELQVKDKFKIVMRVYSQKPRTVLGWTGILFQPNPFEKPNINEGIRQTRKMMLKIIKLGLPIADEALFIESGKYLNDLYSYVALGARSSEDHEHRVYASALPFAVGVKNPTSGDLKVAINSVLACQAKHSFLYDGEQVDSKGNKFAHLILRGGKIGPNYDVNTLKRILKMFSLGRIKNPAIIIDLNHDNSGKQARHQPGILMEIEKYLAKEKKLNKLVKGFMMESFLQAGKQDLAKITAKTCNYNGLSITDDCLGWEETERVIKQLAKIK